MSLFFLVVKTNIDYQFVATFANKCEPTENTLQALQVIKQ